MVDTGSSQRQRPPSTGLARSERGALGRFWEKYDAGLIMGVNGTATAGSSHQQVSPQPESEIRHHVEALTIRISKDIEARIHRGGPKSTDVHLKELEANLGRVVYCQDMWERLKKKPDGTYVCDAAAEKTALLEKAHDALKDKYGACVPQAMDFEVGSEIIGYNKRIKLPNSIGTAATLVEGSKFNRIASLRIGSSSPTPCPQLDTISQEVTQLKQQHQQMMQFQIQQQQVINLTQALLKANTSQPQRPDQDEDIESSD